MGIVVFPMAFAGRCMQGIDWYAAACWRIVWCTHLALNMFVASLVLQIILDANLLMSRNNGEDITYKQHYKQLLVKTFHCSKHIVTNYNILRQLFSIRD